MATDRRHHSHMHTLYSHTHNILRMLLTINTACLCDVCHSEPKLWPQNLQFTIWLLQSSSQQFHSWVLQLIATQVQFSQTRGARVESCSQSFTAFLSEITAAQPWRRMVISDTAISNNFTYFMALLIDQGVKLVLYQMLSHTKLQILISGFNLDHIVILLLINYATVKQLVMDSN